jgi:hypothetical protein
MEILLLLVALLLHAVRPGSLPDLPGGIFLAQ